MNYFAGIDLGSSFSKIVIIDENKKQVAEVIQRTGIDFSQIANSIFLEAIEKAKISKDSVVSIVTTGIGRNNFSPAQFSKPEITCFAKGSYFLFPEACHIIDIGGQDNKVIRLDENGKQLSFKMNRKCAAGTGSFIEEVALKLNITTQKMNEMAMEATTSVPVGSFCTVFAGTEIIHHIRSGKDTNALMRGAFESIAKRVLEMAPINEPLVLTGGAIANNSVLIDIIKDKVPQKTFVPPSPQTVGALGAALYALESQEVRCQAP